MQSSSDKVVVDLGRVVGGVGDGVRQLEEKVGALREEHNQTRDTLLAESRASTDETRALADKVRTFQELLETMKATGAEATEPDQLASRIRAYFRDPSRERFAEILADQLQAIKHHYDQLKSDAPTLPSERVRAAGVTNTHRRVMFAFAAALSDESLPPQFAAIARGVREELERDPEG